MSRRRSQSTGYPPWKTNVAKSGGITAVMVAAMLATGDREPLDIAVGIPPFMFMVYVILSSRSSRRARKAEEMGELDAVMYLSVQCERLRSRVYGAGGSLGGHGT